MREKGQENRREKGFRAIGGVAQKLASGLAPKGQKKGAATGLAPLARLKAQWPAVVGEEIARLSEPDALLAGRSARSAGPTLRLRVSGAASLEVQHRIPQIVERVNGFFGHRFIEDVRLVQGVVAKRAGPHAVPAPDPALTRKMESRVSEVEDPDLKAALARLGARIAQRSTTGRRGVLLGAAGAFAIARGVRAQTLTPDQIKQVAVRPADHVMGNPDAPHVIIDYFSLTCPHCANFSAAVLPELQRQLIAPGKVKFIYRHFPSDSVATHASQLAECAGPQKFFAAVDALFKAQVDWLTSSDPEGEMVKLLQGQGIVGGDCLGRDDLLDRIVDDVQSGQMLRVRFTPTLFIDAANVGNPGGLPEIAKILALSDR
ncbi:MAG: DUF721 domain-containing protein [Alphaproteobacteria bacterium]|nr:DUF721 domain-containing protein [Alphaproteobacteria bacterium]